MQISCFMQSSILTPYGGILSNDLDFSKLNFVTKLPNFRSSKGPNKKCFLIRELQMRKYFIGIMFLHKLDILNRNLNGLFQKFNPVVTKLCAVTKLGDLTVRINLKL